MRRLTASGLALAAKCPAAYALPCDAAESTDAQAAGHGRHGFLDALVAAWDAPHIAEATLSGAPLDSLAPMLWEHALATVPADAPHRATCEAINVAELLELTGANEGEVETNLSFAWSPVDDTAEALGVAAHRAYPDSAGLPGTLDWLVTQPDGRVEVIDFKGSEPVTRASENLQLALYALQVARARGLDEVGVAIVYVHPDGRLVRDAARLDVFGLLVAAERVRAIWQKVLDAREAHARGALDTATGDHCARCPAMASCPAMVSLVRELATAPPAAETLPSLSDEAAGEAWVKLAMVKAVVDRMDAALRQRAMRAGLPLPDGRRLMPCDTTRRTVDARRALPVLRELVGDRAESVVEQSVPSTAVDSLASEVAKASGEKIKAVKARVWDALRSAGAVRDSTYPVLRVRKAGSDDAEA